jgi:hypothetical protein
MVELESLKHPICQTLSGKLSWSHYCELLIVSDKDKQGIAAQQAM